MLSRYTELVITGVFIAMFASQCLSQESDPATHIKALVEQNRFDQAKSIVDEWIREYPEDLDAKAWHARLLAWTNHWKEAETEGQSFAVL